MTKSKYYGLNLSFLVAYRLPVSDIFSANCLLFSQANSKIYSFFRLRLSIICGLSIIYVYKHNVVMCVFLICFF